MIKPLRKSLLLLTMILPLLMGCSSDEKGTKALFNTRAEAEKAAKEFNCSGAHKMGEKWMPCKNHSDHMNHHNHK